MIFTTSVYFTEIFQGYKNAILKPRICGVVVTFVPYRSESRNSLKDDPNNSSTDLSLICLPFVIRTIFGGV